MVDCILFKSGHFEDLSSSEDSDSAPPRSRPSRNRAKGISIHDGPQAIAKFRVGGTSKQCGSVIFRCFVCYWLCVDTAELILNELSLPFSSRLEEKYLLH